MGLRGIRVRAPVRWTAVALGCLIGAGAPAAAKEMAMAPAACTEVFGFGFWGFEPRPYDRGLEGLLDDMRRRSMNVIVAGPQVSGEPGGPEALRRQVALCRQYGVSVLPFLGGDLNLLTAATEALRDDPAVLGWYIKDEPSPDFLPEFQRAAAQLQRVAPGQPALCLFYRPDAAAVFAPFQPLLLTDCYPLTYNDGGTSLGPHFAARDSTLKLDRGLSRFNMWGNGGVIEWMDLCRGLCGDQAHWVTLQIFESGDGHVVRWRQPTAAELRLQTWQAIAGGAKGINYFRYALLVDDYGVPQAARHGEGTPLLDEIGRLGAELTPMGPLLIDADVAEPVSVLTTLRPTAPLAPHVEVRRLHSRSRAIDYLVVVNTDVLVRATAQINLSAAWLAGRQVYDLHRLQPASVEEWPGAVTLQVALEPGGGALFALASQADCPLLAQTILRGRAANEAAVVDLDYRLAERLRVELGAVQALRLQYQQTLAAGDGAAALTAIRQAAAALRQAMQADASVNAVQTDLAYVRQVLSRLAGEPLQFDRRLTRAYQGLWERFWRGEAASVRATAAQLRRLVAVLETAAAVEGTDGLAKAQVDETALRRLEAALAP